MAETDGYLLMRSINFEFLKPKWPEFAGLGGFAEAYAHNDPIGAIGKLRAFCEQSAKYIQKSLHRVRPYPDQATSEYIAYLMWILMSGSSLLRSISSATIPHLTGEKLKEVQIPVPPVALQQRYSQQCRRIDAAKRSVACGVQVANELFNSMVQRAFRGEL